MAVKSIVARANATTVFVGSSRAFLFTFKDISSKSLFVQTSSKHFAVKEGITDECYRSVCIFTCPALSGTIKQDLSISLPVARRKQSCPVTAAATSWLPCDFMELISE